MRGFTLIEMAMVLMIIALVLGGLLPVLTGQIEQRRINETRVQLAEIREALLGFILANNRLPCPANGAANTGQEDFIGAGPTLLCKTISGNASGGVLPWATLGLNETDAWGRRFTYRVTSAFADGADGTSEAAAAACATSQGVSFKMCSEANLKVLISASGATTVADKLPAIVVSHGANGNGAYTREGIKLALGSDDDEKENSDNDLNFVSHDLTPNFDDLVVWIPPNLILSRMISAGKLP